MSMANTRCNRCAPFIGARGWSSSILPRRAHGTIWWRCLKLGAAVSAVNGFEYPARHWFAHMAAAEARMDKYAMVPGGFVAVIRALGKVIEVQRGRVLLNTLIRSIESSNGKATGVVIEQDSEPRVLVADIVISNTGPSGTVALVGEEAFGR